MSLILKFRTGFVYSYRFNCLYTYSSGLKCRSKIGKHFLYNGIFNSLWFKTFCSELPKNPVKKENNSVYLKYDEVIQRRRNQAARSLLVQVHSELSCAELFDYCNNIAPVTAMFHYILTGNNNFVLVEFSSEEGFHEVVTRVTHLERGESVGGVPVCSPLVWFRATKAGGAKSGCPTSAPPHSVLKTRQPATLDQEQVDELMHQALSPGDEMEILYRGTRLDELGTRLRFLCARQLESSLTGLFPACRALPFGSSVNGLGRIGSDLDLHLEYDSRQVDTSSRLVYQAKNSIGRSQRQMEAVADLLSLFLPGVSNIRRILRAKVPIVKFNHDMAALECDLSMSSMSGVYMSELVWLWGELDSGFRPLVFWLKRWSEVVSLTHPSKAPGPWITNFTLTLLAVFYLQSLKRLPTVEKLFTMARSEDVRWADEVDCTFARDPGRIIATIEGKRRGREEDERREGATLLRGFFEFYSSFDFGTTGLSVVSGRGVVKPDPSPLYIVNPLERSLNVAKNASPKETERLRVELRSALWTIDTSPTASTFLDLMSQTLDVNPSGSERLKRSKVGKNNEPKKKQQKTRTS